MPPKQPVCNSHRCLAGDHCGCCLQVGALEEACKAAQERAQEREAALHAVQLEMEGHEQSVHADAASQKQSLKALQEELREALSDKEDAQRQACLPHTGLFPYQYEVSRPPARRKCCCQQLCC